MDAALTELGHALRQCLVIIGDDQSRTNPDRHTERLRDVSEKIERLEQSPPSKIDPQLHSSIPVSRQNRNAIKRIFAAERPKNFELQK